MRGALPIAANPLVNIVEPTLEGEGGHCRSFLLSLCHAGNVREVSFRVYGGRGGSLPGAEGERCEVVPYFSRRLRRLQAFLLYRKLLEGAGRIFVSTAGRTDMVLLTLAAKGEIPPGKVFLYFHWLRPSPRKLVFFRRFAVSHPGVTVVGPTEAVIRPFRECGFRDARIVPYPITPSAPESPGTGGPFRHVLYAGAARRDKGFPKVVDLVCRMVETGVGIPVTVQASPDHYEKYDEGIRADLERLRKVSPPWLRMFPDTLGGEEYRKIFDGAIVLQPYAREDFADRVSGVTLDAFSAGAPVIATAGTWMAQAIGRFGAGVAIEELNPAALLAAVKGVRDEYPRYRRNALDAGRVLQEEHSGGHLLEALLSPDGEAP
ncbi:MAG: glycosyltransferase [Candidatus Deferrimicrobiaceae bacterium]